MAGFINDTVFDNGLSTAATNGDTLSIVSTAATAPPTTYAGVTANECGVKTAVTPTGPTNGATSGRRIYVGAISDGTVNDTTVAAYWALHDGTSTLYASGSLSATQAVTSGNTFTLTQVNVTILDAT